MSSRSGSDHDDSEGGDYSDEEGSSRSGDEEGSESDYEDDDESSRQSRSRDGTTDDDEDDDEDDDSEFEDEPEKDEDQLEEEREDDEKDREEEERNRRNRVAAIWCCMCCCLVIIAIIILVLLLKKDKETQAPTQAPTKNPFVFPAVQDTYLSSGPDSGVSFGASEQLVIRNNGNEEDGGVSYALIQFDLDDLPPEDSTNEREFRLRLSHVVSVAEKNQEITVVKLPTDINLDMEQISWETYARPPASETVDGPTFVVQETDTSVEVDVTSLVVGSSSSSTTRAASLRRGQLRDLQDNDRTLLILLESRGLFEEGSIFRSLEFSDESMRPKIVIADPSSATTASTGSPSSPPPSSTGAPAVSPVTSTPPPTVTSRPTITAKPTQSPSVSPAPTASPAPTSNPTPSPPPTKSATTSPTVSPSPTTSPTQSPMPSISPKPTGAPTTSPAPTITGQPTLSMQPSLCSDYVLPYLIPPLTGMRGTGPNNPLPEGAVTYVSQSSKRVVVRITQLWSTDQVVWIAPYYHNGDDLICPKTRNVEYQSTMDEDVNCRDGTATFSFIVNDESLIPGNEFVLPDDCTVDDDDITAKKALYIFQLQCDPPPKECEGMPPR